jgi:hypothetical protein
MIDLLAATESPGSNLSPGYQIAAVFIPVAAVVVTGVFAVMNGRPHPSVKLKNLIDVSKDLPPSIHAKYALERVILREIGRFDLATSSWYRRTVGITLVALIWIVLVLLMAQHPAVFHFNPSWTTPIVLGGNIIAPVISLISGVVLGYRTAQHWRPYITREDALKVMENREVTQAQAIKDGATEDGDDSASEDADESTAVDADADADDPAESD